MDKLCVYQNAHDYVDILVFLREGEKSFFRNEYNNISCIVIYDSRTVYHFYDKSQKIIESNTTGSTFFYFISSYWKNYLVFEYGKDEWKMIVIPLKHA